MATVISLWFQVPFVNGVVTRAIFFHEYKVTFEREFSSSLEQIPVIVWVEVKLFSWRNDN